MAARAVAWAWRGLLLGGLFCSTWAAAADGSPKALDYARPPTFSEAVLSPSGDSLAMLVGGLDGRQRLVVMSLKPREKARVVAAYKDAEVVDIHWVSDQRQIYSAVSFDQGVVVPEGQAGIFAVNADGSDQRHLVAWQRFTDTGGPGIQTRLLSYEWTLYRTLDDGSNDVLMSRNSLDGRGEFRGTQLARLDTVTGILRKLGEGAPPFVRSWLTDAQGEPRVVTSEHAGRIRTHVRAAPGQPWVQIQDEDALSGRAFEPLLLEPGGQLVVTALRDGDVREVYAYDLAQHRLVPEPLVALAGFDLGRGLEYDSRTMAAVGMHFRTDRPASVWFDPAMQSLQKSVDAALPPGRFNRLICGRCASSSHLVVESTSDSQPGEFYLFDRAARKLKLLGSKYTGLPEATQGRRSFHRVPARDGLPLPVYVTHPRGAKDTDRLPAVVWVHGGPWVRGTDRGWRAEPQFLASLGYRVLEPEFRGSEGYGQRHFAAGLKQWGEAMQDDLADTVAWAAAQGLIDPKRVCIMGASYGGYAALMSPIRHPGTYRCAIAFAALTDMELRYDAWGSDLSEEGRRYTLPQLMGDPVKDAQLLKNSSPLQRVSEFKIPVLLAHGAEDTRLPVEHAEKFVAAARKAGVDVQYQVYPLEGHGWVLPADHADYLLRVQAFLARQLGGERQP
jgi:dienelactone hydrolase